MEFSQRPPLGFQTFKDTGIPALQQWLIHSTLQTTSDKAEKVLENIISFQMAINSWLKSSERGLHIIQEIKNSMKMIFEEHKDALLSVRTLGISYFCFLTTSIESYYNIQERC
jgi:hypothetical protein